MGIAGIYKELGHGRRTALAKLAVQHFVRKNRPFRLAIDIAIWQFQMQAGEGGKNPALRTLYHRSLKLLSLSIQPIFVFDGPQRPKVKRGKQVKCSSGYVQMSNAAAKRLLGHFGFLCHDAPGEAEAECAALQKAGIVDAVLSEDVDTLMFGCNLTLRNWTAEGVRGNKTPTHVSVHDATETAPNGLTPQGMILVALMSGGDYAPAGIDKCGPVVAAQLARAGFGEDLSRVIAEEDKSSLQNWRDRLQDELTNNTNKYLSKKHPSVIIPRDFPDREVLSYYAAPIISAPSRLQVIETTFKASQNCAIDVAGLREYCAETFNWPGLIGAKVFVRGLAPALLVHDLSNRAMSSRTDRESMGTKELAEAHLVKSISGRREHWVTDGEPELRLAFVPADVVNLDLSKEEDIERQDFANCVTDDNGEDQTKDCSPTRSASPSKEPLSTYDPNAIERVWILESYAKLGVPLLVEDYVERLQRPKHFVSRKAREQATLRKAGMAAGAMDKFVRLTKPGIYRTSQTEGGKTGNVTTAPKDQTQTPVLDLRDDSLSLLSPPGLTSSSDGRAPQFSTPSRQRYEHRMISQTPTARALDNLYLEIPRAKSQPGSRAENISPQRQRAGVKPTYCQDSPHKTSRARKDTILEHFPVVTHRKLDFTLSQPQATKYRARNLSLTSVSSSSSLPSPSSLFAGPTTRQPDRSGDGADAKYDDNNGTADLIDKVDVADTTKAHYTQEKIARVEVIDISSDDGN